MKGIFAAGTAYGFKSIEDSTAYFNFTKVEIVRKGSARESESLPAEGRVDRWRLFTRPYDRQVDTSGDVHATVRQRSTGFTNTHGGVGGPRER